jgi:hypothetical protein
MSTSGWSGREIWFRQRRFRTTTTCSSRSSGGWPASGPRYAGLTTYRGRRHQPTNARHLRRSRHRHRLARASGLEEAKLGCQRHLVRLVRRANHLPVERTR